MGRSFKLFSVRGIDLKVHITFPLILLFAAFQFGVVTGDLSGALFGIVAISLLFVLVTLHEFGHSFAAQYYGLEVKQIVLSPIGGVAQLEEMPDNPVQELVIALAGPAVNLAAALIMGLAVLVFGLDIVNPLAILGGAAGFGLAALFSYVFVYNIFLALFNMIPAFPLDGGRVLRALLAMRLDYVRATNIASTVGRVAAIGLGIYGLSTGGFFLILIAIFIFSAAGQEAQYTRYRQALKGYTVQHAYSPSAYQLEPTHSIRQASDLMLLGRQSSFPITMSEQLIGFVPNAVLVEALRTLQPYDTVATIMRTDIEPVLPHEPLFEVRRRMELEGLDALPVVSGGRYAGLISREQIDTLHRLAVNAPNAAPPRVQTAQS